MDETIAVCIPRETVNDETARILSWKLQSGSLVEKEQLVCEVETSKVVMEIHAPASGRLQYSAGEGEEVPIGAAICYIAPAEETMPQPVTRPATNPAARLSLAARTAAAQYGVDAACFAAGTLVRREDVLRQAGKQSAAGGGAQTVPISWSDLPRRKLLESQILYRGRAGAIQSSVTFTCGMGQLSARVQKLGLGIAGLQSVIIFEAARLLRKYPEFNAIHDCGRIGYYKDVNLGWAVDGGFGLMVPVIGSADKMGIQEIAATMQRQLDAYLAQELSARELTGGTFTVTDLSGYGASFFQPLIPGGQSAILGIGSGGPWPGSGAVSLTLAFDHQLAEGKRAAQFLQELSLRLEEHGGLSVATPEPEPYCVVCHRDRETLQQNKLVLLRSEVPPGFVCSLCIAGW